MAPTRPPRNRLRSAALVFVILLALSVVVMAYLASTAPVRLVSSAPGAGELLEAPPPSVSLTFTDRLDPGDIHVSVAAAAGTTMVFGASRVDGRTVTQPVAIGGDGDYVIAYHVTFGNGQDLSGVLRFRVVGAGTTVARADQDPVTRKEPAEPPEAAGGHHGSADPLTIAVIAVDGLVVLVALALMRRRSRRRRRLVVEQRRPAHY